MSKSSHGTRGWELKSDRIGIGLVVVLPDRTEHEVDVQVGAGVTVDGLAAALVSHLGSGSREELFHLRTSSWLRPSESLTGAGLLHGDRIFLGPRSEQPSSPDRTHESSKGEHELVVVGGASIGMRWPLHGGSTRVGRGRDCDITIDDPALSRIHVVIEVREDAVRITDAGSTNGTFSNGIRVGDGHRLRPGEVFEAGACLFRVEQRRPGGPPPAVAAARGRILFNRPPRVAIPEPQTTFEVPPPPSDRDRPRLPLAMAGVPLLLALVLWRLFPDSPSLLVIMALSPIIVVLSYLEDRRRGSRGAHRNTQEWRASIEEVVARVAAARDAYAERARTLAPTASDLQLRALERRANLWERRPNDSDFLLVRCGWGDRPWPLELHQSSIAAGSLEEEADAHLEPLRTLPSVPLTLDLRDAGVAGISGDAPSVEAVARWLVIQLATLHSPEEVSIATVLDPEHQEAWRWMSWLPHVERLQQGAIAADPSETLEELLAILDLRTGSERDTLETRSGPHPTIIVLAHHRARLPRAPLARLLRDGPRAGIFSIWMGAAPDELPGHTGTIVELAGPDEVVVTTAETGAALRGAREGITEEMARETALALAPLIDAAPASEAEDLPKEVSLYALLGVDDPGVDDVSTAWEARSSGLSIPVGVGIGGRVEIDLVADGPHSLVGGTTGSGKSELLQTLVASLAWHCTPEDLNLLLIDYKGGAAFTDCVDLPHTVGLVTDLDAHLARRALVSLDAELRRRELLLRDAGARDISDLSDATLLPRLILLIDEFAALIKELPSFVDGVMDIAQRGRSLGLHLVLATQRPAGVVNDAIRANTNLRIALRVADEPDSDDVIGIRDAARIPRSIPGRGFLRRGHQEVEVFQAAFSGTAATNSIAEIEVRDRRGEPAGTSSREAVAETQLQRAVGLIRRAAQGAGLGEPRSPWLPPLPDVLPLQRLEGDAGAFGLVDRPEEQRQEVATFDPGRDGGLLVYGTGGSGKTTLLRSLVVSLATGSSVAALHVYALDFGSGGLRAVAALPHCGDVVMGQDHERIERAFALIRSEIERRKALVAADGVGDFSELQKAADGMMLPRVLIILDGYEAFSAAFERVNMGELVELLPRLVSDGRSLGVHFAVTGGRRAGIPAALAAQLGKRIVLRMGDEDEYLSLGLGARAGGKIPPGRGYLDAAELQVAIVGHDPAPVAQQAAIMELGSHLEAGGVPQRPARIQALPNSVELSSLEDTKDPLVAVAGLRESDLGTAAIDLTEGHFLVAGPYRSGRSTTLLTIARSLRSSSPSISLWLLAPRKTPLIEETIWTRAETESTACAAAMEEIAQDQPGSPLVVFIDDADDLAEGPAAYALESLAKRRDGGVSMVVAAESLALHRSFTGWISEVRKHKHGLLLDPDLDLDGDLLGVKLPRRQKRAFPPGRGYLVVRGRIELVQTARP